MRIPTIRGLIDRRVLVNFRVDPDRIAATLPNPFRPQLINGCAIAGICLIRLKQIRPAILPSFCGIASENAAHRIAVQWDVDGEVKTGVYVPRRDTSSRLNALAGGRIVPGVHHFADFDVRETDERYRISMTSHDGTAHLLVDANTTTQLPDDSVFDSVEDVSQFFEAGSLGYSPRRSNDGYDGLELRSYNWHVEPLSINEVESSFFNDQLAFPAGTVEFDNALLMRGIDHEWHSRESLCCEV